MADETHETSSFLSNFLLSQMSVYILKSTVYLDARVYSVVILLQEKLNL